MDAEGIKSLLWILVWGGLFFLMMRYGCGSHIMGGHGHGSHGGHGESEPERGRAIAPRSRRTRRNWISK